MRKIDELVARLVMKWTPDEYGLYQGGVQRWPNNDCRYCEWDASFLDMHSSAEVFAPSVDPAAAMAVVDKMNVKPRNIGISFSPVSDRWLVQFLSYRNKDGTFTVNEGGSAEHASRELAICLAALRAVACPESEIETALKGAADE